MPLTTIDAVSLGASDARALLQKSVAPLKAAEARKAGEASDIAFHKDPLILYLRADETDPFIPRRIVNAFILTLWLLGGNKIVLTANAGSALLVASSPDTGIKSVTRRITEFILIWALSALRYFKTPEARKRTVELKTKTEAVISSALGDSIKEMIYVDLLATDPQCQGRGYGGALLDSITRQADLESRGTWLQSGNVDNTGFYMSRGFKTVGEALIGDDSPAWQGEPIVVRTMFRVPKKRV